MEFFHESRNPLGTLGYLLQCSVQSKNGCVPFTTPHVHEYFEILMCKCGSFRIKINDQLFTLEKGDIAVIDPMDVHGTYTLTQGSNTYMVLKFVPELMYISEQPLYEIDTLSAYMRLRSSHRRIFRADYVQKTGMGNIMEKIFDEYSAHKFGYILSIRAEIILLFVKILRDWHDNNAPAIPDAQSIAQLQAAYEFMEANYASSIKLSDVASHCHMSYTAFSRFFSKHAGCSFSEALLMTRVKKSIRLVALTDSTITEIAAQTGFSSTSHYIQCFKAVTGKTPLKYRACERRAIHSR